MNLFLPAVLSLLLTPLFPALLQAQQSLDTSFGKNGQLTTGFSIYNDKAFAVTVQTDGKILVAGQSENGVDTDIALARYHGNGTLDTSFNATGKITVAVGSGDDRGLALAVQEDQKIVVAGTTDNGNDLDMAVIRLTPEGLPDMDFDHDGQVSISLPTTNDQAQTLLLQADGKIILAGSSEKDDSTQLIVARLNRDGSLDSTFGNNGLVTISDNDNSAAYSGALQKDDRILLAGFMDKEEQRQAALFSFLSNGQRDQNFGEQGISLAGTDNDNSVFYDVELLEDGKILAAGAIQGTEYHSILLAGFTDKGIADIQFNRQGLVQTDLGTDTVAYALSLAKDGSIYLAGSSSNGRDTDFILLHYSATGLPVSSSGGEEEEEEEEEETEEHPATGLTSYTLTDFDQYNDIARALFILDNGTVLLAGSAENGKDTDFGLLLFDTIVLPQGRTENGISAQGFYIATTPPTLVTRNSAATGGYVSANNRTWPILERGVCFGITHAPGLKDFTEADTTTDVKVDTDETEAVSTLSSLMTIKTETVREGCVSSGEGPGEFRADLLDITPNTRYYVRSYAKVYVPPVSSDDTEDVAATPEYNTIIYGNEIPFQTKDDACFIATAAYGTPDNSHVLILRQFRDVYLKASSIGRTFISAYYALSPPLAQWIALRPAAQRAVRIAMAPVTGFSFLALNPAFAAQLFCLFFLSLGLLQFIYGLQKPTARKKRT